jgi:hypothetical protein
MTNCKHEKELVCIECNADMTIKEMLDEARADERRKMESEWQSRFDGLAKSTGLIEKTEKEARASGFREGQRSKTAYKLGVLDGIKKGQADLIKKLTSREIIIKMLNENYKVPDLMAGSYTKNEVLRNEEQRIDAVRAVMKKASSRSSERLSVASVDTSATSESAFAAFSQKSCCKKAESKKKIYEGGYNLECDKL